MARFVYKLRHIVAGVMLALTLGSSASRLLINYSHIRTQLDGSLRTASIHATCHLRQLPVYAAVICEIFRILSMLNIHYEERTQTLLHKAVYRTSNLIAAHFRIALYNVIT
jgi:hypothetical protein